MSEGKILFHYAPSGSPSWRTPDNQRTTSVLATKIAFHRMISTHQKHSACRDSYFVSGYESSGNGYRCKGLIYRSTNCLRCSLYMFPVPSPVPCGNQLGYIIICPEENLMSGSKNIQRYTSPNVCASIMVNALPNSTGSELVSRLQDGVHGTAIRNP